jgi:hypothetical protein
MSAWQKLASPLTIVIVAVLVVVGLVAYNEWSINQRKNNISAAYENVQAPNYARLTLKKYEDVKKNANSKATVASWVYRYTVMKNSAAVSTDDVHTDMADDLKKAGFTIDQSPAGANDTQKKMQIYAHKNNVDLQINFDKPDFSTSMVAIVYEK